MELNVKQICLIISEYGCAIKHINSVFEDISLNPVPHVYHGNIYLSHIYIINSFSFWISDAHRWTYADILYFVYYRDVYCYLTAIQMFIQVLWPPTDVSIGTIWQLEI